jgi:hypothetical protein
LSSPSDSFRCTNANSVSACGFVYSKSGATFSAAIASAMLPVSTLPLPVVPPHS